MQLKYITNIDYIHWVHTKTAQIPWKIRSNSWENLIHYYLLTCCIVVNVIVWEIGRGKQAAGQSHAPGQVMWTKCLPRDTIQAMGSSLRNSNKIICKQRKKNFCRCLGKFSGNPDDLFRVFLHTRESWQFRWGEGDLSKSQNTKKETSRWSRNWHAYLKQRQ